MPTQGKILVKVGKKSKLRFRGVQAFRAITLDELETIYRLNPDISVVVIENIKQSDDNRLIRFITKFESDRDTNKAFFFVENNDDVTCGAADELAADIYMNKSELYNAIKTKCGLVVDIDLSTCKEFTGDSAEYDAFDDSFSDALDTIESTDTNSFVSKLPDIDSKDDLKEFDLSIVNENSSETRLDKDIDEPADIEESVGINSIQDQNSTNESQSKQFDELRNQISEYSDEITQLKKLIKAIEDERDAFKAKLIGLSESEVMEDPITLVEYEELKRKLDEAIKSENSTVEADRVIEELENERAKLVDITSQLEEYKKRLRESGIKLSNTQSQLYELKRQLEELRESRSESDQSMIGEIEALKLKRSLEVSSRLYIMGVLDKAIEDLYYSSRQISEFQDEIKTLEDKVAERDGTIKDLSSKIDSLNDQVEKLGESEEIINQLMSEKAALESANNEQLDTITELQDELNSSSGIIRDLKSQVEDVDKRIELARNFVGKDLEDNKREVIEWRTKYEVANAQFTQKEAQYNTLIQTIGMNESGVHALLENSKTMEEINKTLRDQIVMLKNDLEKSKKEAIFAKQTAAALEETNKNMRVSMKAMTVGMSGGVSASSGVPPFNYDGRGMVIPVFGCGSFGITTTAMSLANKLSSQARVLYIDFDMIAPKADSWFKMNPLIRNVPDIDPNSAKATGLGLFVDKQVQYFLNNSSSIIMKPVQTKNGCIDYISGFYVKPDAIKLMSSDFASFLNYCGNNYTYVIIDFGRLGSSDINDQIIKAFTDIAYRSVAVTTSDKFEIRTFRMKIGEAKIDINNIAWLVNMCEKTSLEDTAKRSISPAVYSMIPFNPDIYGKRIDFTKERVTRDKLGLFMEKVLFRK